MNHQHARWNFNDVARNVSPPCRLEASVQVDDLHNRHGLHPSVRFEMGECVAD